MYRSFFERGIFMNNQKKPDEKKDNTNDKEIDDSNIENVLDKMKNNINNLKLYKPNNEKPNKNNINNY